MPMVFGAPASRVANTPGLPSVSIRSACWKPTSFNNATMWSAPAGKFRFSAAIAGSATHALSRARERSWLFAISVLNGVRSTSAAVTPPAIPASANPSSSFFIVPKMRRSAYDTTTKRRTRSADGNANAPHRLPTRPSACFRPGKGMFTGRMSNPACPLCTLTDVLAHADRWECSTCGHEWPKEAVPEAARVVKDAHGTPLADGDTVVLIKDLKLRGGTGVL